ncbi:MAG: M14 family metallopeptidase [Thermoanaerobaculia bacterium]
MSRSRRLSLALCFAVWPAMMIAAEQPGPAIDPESLLPPTLTWDGASRSRIAGAEDPWRTPAEKSSFRTTPDYDTTVSWVGRLAEISPRLHLTSLGESLEGRPIWMVIASADGARSPEELHSSGRPILLAQAGIHSGEIDGKDAGLMLLRDLIDGGSQTDLLEGASFLFVPILNVDGHERRSAYNRMNQRGPGEMGWRTNAANLNLNRDYSKLDTPEIRALVRAIDRWQPDLYLDLHVTDGMDKQHDVTWGFHGPHSWSPGGGTWLAERLDVALVRELEAAGHIPGPHIFSLDRRDPTRGILKWIGGARYSDGYGAARHLPTVLVENHSLKPYEQRVLGTYVLLATSLRTLGEFGAELRAAVRADQGRRLAEITLGWGKSEEPNLEPMEFPGVEVRVSPSEISGSERIDWTGKKVDLEVPVFETTRPLGKVAPPPAYWIPAAWPEVIERLKLHGVVVEELSEPRKVDVEVYRLGEPQYGEEPYEGRLTVKAEASLERRRMLFPAGSVRVRVDQPLGTLAVLLLEPASSDSFFQWGFFLSIFQRTEYGESYVLEPLAEQMLADPAIEAAFSLRLKEDPAFAADPRQRLEWFYERSPFFDERWRLYPVAREVAAGR